eukprot:1142260-Pelagomonas_calceolata.AAC.9
MINQYNTTVQKSTPSTVCLRRWTHTHLQPPGQQSSHTWVLLLDNDQPERHSQRIFIQALTGCMHGGAGCSSVHERCQLITLDCA